jgi:dihydrofolate reductase
MGNLVVHMHATVDNRIANADGGFWEPFPWGEDEQRSANEVFRAAGTWVMTRPIYEAVVPWWDAVARGEVPADVGEVSAADREFAAIFAELTKIAISNHLPSGLRGDLAPQLAGLKAQSAKTIILSCGPATLGPLTGVPGLIDELVLGVHPAVLGSGPRLFDAVRTDLALALVEAKVFAGGALLVHYRVGKS